MHAYGTDTHLHFDIKLFVRLFMHQGMHGAPIRMQDCVCVCVCVHGCSAQYEQAHKVIPRGALVELPVSHTAARSCPNGRPAIPFITFAFGARAFLVHAAPTNDPTTPGANGTGATNTGMGLMSSSSATTTINMLTPVALHELPELLKKVGVAGDVMMTGRASLGAALSPVSPHAPATQLQMPQADTLSGARQLLSSFAGPLSPPSTNRDKLVK